MINVNTEITRRRSRTGRSAAHTSRHRSRTGMVRLAQPPSDTLDPPVSVLHAGRFVIYVYADDVASHMGIPPKFTRRLL
jgi:hypothetical protein